VELSTDILLRGEVWANALDKLNKIFSTRTNYSIYLLSVAIGIMYDKRIKKYEDGNVNPRSVPRNIVHNNDNGRLDFMYQAAILTTRTENFTEEQRMQLAFGDNPEELLGMKKTEFLTQFANFGVTKLAECIGVDDLESMEKIKDFLNYSIEGINFDIDDIPDTILIEDE